MGFEVGLDWLSHAVARRPDTVRYQCIPSIHHKAAPTQAVVEPQGCSWKQHASEFQLFLQLLALPMTCAAEHVQPV